MALSIKRRDFSARLVVIAISLALCFTAGVKVAVAETERLLSFQSNCYYVLHIGLAPEASEAAGSYVSKLNQDLQPTPMAYVILNDRRTLRGSDGKIIGNGEDMAVQFALLTLLPDSSFESHIVFIKGFSSNGDLVDYLIEKGLTDASSSASEITSTHEVDRDEDGTKVKSKIRVLDPDGTIRFKTEFMLPEPYHYPPVSEDFVAPAPFKARYGYAPDRVFEVNRGRTVYEYFPPPPELLIDLDINLNPSNPEGTIFNNSHNVITRFVFAHIIQTADEIAP